ncbi:MAG: response regulator [Pseudomonadales bacterium]|jgi:DNA-binding response OmpR family regulator|nr:response regulator [Pseudomonadales bacterium]
MTDKALTRLLLIEDDVRLAQLIQDYLSQENFQVHVEHRGDTALEHFQSTQVDIVILDLMLPGMDGLKLCSALRERYHGPILILTAKNSDIDHVMGLELGADDFVHKPIEPPVLLARLRALLRRSQAIAADAPQEETEELVFGQLSINPKARQVRLKGEIVEFTTQEFDLLYCLARHAGKVLSRDDIFNSMRGIDYDGLDRTVDVRISRLRKKLKDNPHQPHRIKTVWGKGYLFVADAWA